MRILVGEYVTGGGLRAQTLPRALAQEGDLMLGALVKDLAALSGVELWITRDDRLSEPPDVGRILRVNGERDLWSVLSDVLPQVDGLWPIAPETDGILARICQMAERLDCRLLASDSDTIALCASKIQTARHLKAHGVPVVPTWLPAEAQDNETGWVAKPDDGVDCAGMVYLADRSALNHWRRQDSETGGFVVQPYVAGPAGSLSLLCRGGEAWLLTCNRQRVTRPDGGFRYEGGEVGGLEAHRQTCEPLAQAIARALPGLWGYIGVDLILSPTGPLVLEINPRLTTSYVGLGPALGINPAGLVLSVIDQPVRAVCVPVTPITVSLGVAATDV